MSYLDPQSWTDVDAGGNPLEWSTRKNKLLYPGYEMLRRALIERCTAIGTSVPSPLDVPRAPDKIYRASPSWLLEFHNKITDLIGAFVNYEDSGGDWSGVSYGQPENVAPIWTEASLMTAIGDPSRIAPYTNFGPRMFYADWSLQQYKILNKLIWVRDQFHAGWTTGNTWQCVGRWKYMFSAPTWAQAVAAWLAGSWTGPLDGPHSELFGWGSHVNTPPHAPYYQILRNHAYFNRGATEFVGSPDFAIEGDWYTPPAFIDTYPPNVEVYNAEGQNFLENEFNLQATKIYPIGTPWKSDDYGRIETAPPQPPTAPVPDSTSFKGWAFSKPTSQGPMIFVKRYNVTNGFKFAA